MGEGNHRKGAGRVAHLCLVAAAVLGLSLLPAQTLAVIYPTVTLHPASGPPGQSFVATGVNFHPNAPIYAVETVLRSTTTSDASGNVKVYFQVSTVAQPGPLYVHFFEGNMLGTPIAGAVFQVTGPPTPVPNTVTPAPNSVAPMRPSSPPSVQPQP